MAWTYTTLTQAIQDYLESDEATLVANIPVIVKQAEDRILKKVQLPNFRKNSTGSMTDGDQYLGVPTDFLAPYSLAIDNSGLSFLLFKDVNFIREVYPDVSSEGVPKYYSLFEDEFFIIGPTPDSNYVTELHYFYRPTSIVDASTSWLGTNAESCLLYACLLEGYKFQKGDADMMTEYKEGFLDGINNLKDVAERNRSDQYRSG